MIKIETLGMLDVAKINPVLKADHEVANYSFLVDNGVTYLICNTIVGDKAYENKHVFAAGEYLNGYALNAWVGQKLVIDDEHIAYAESKSYADLVAGETILTIKEDGKLTVSESAPGKGLYLVVTDKTTLVGKAIKARIVNAG